MAIASFLSRVATMHLHFKFCPLSHTISSPGEVALSEIQGLECTELTVGNGTAESLWVRIEEQTNNANIIVGVAIDLPARTVTPRIIL